MASQSRPSTARPTSRGPYPVENRAARAADHPSARVPFAVHSSRLRDHLLHDHGRTAGEIEGLPLAGLHRFEHVEQAMGLNDLSHHHPSGLETDVGGHAASTP
jgi:hypothetical protein